jgi:hypothetical protein
VSLLSSLCVYTFLSHLNPDKSIIVARALLSLLFVQTIFDKIFVYHANSRTDLTEDHALRPVPEAAGIIFIKADLYLNVSAYGTEPFLLIDTKKMFLYAS